MDSQPTTKLNAREIAARIREEIAAGTFGPGDRLPGARTYAKKLGVALMTVQNAYTQLQEEGLVEGRTGSGTYVRDPAPGQQAPREAARRLTELQAEVSRVSTELAGLAERIKQLEAAVEPTGDKSGS
ncbi:winged helix-turn-helix domain-containing protein [Streptomyces sp. ME01-18a]|uniref:winged helix-turn-helix domain-containing protein n=1 Tax=Streptomyces sp. ME01-18a TaxID=3028669 RepID=UPI0029BF9B80|nr:winged helix-turn-helix domain-containing protein [Streptomyces sp. ME01-18a]MDX3429485.1 winged helix-turn-helix domain-containing protein [Streptomyces sp. ME01-18a]